MWTLFVVPFLELLAVLAVSALLFGLIEQIRPAAATQGPLRLHLDRDAFQAGRERGEGWFTALRSALVVGEGLRTDFVHAFVNPPVIKAAVGLLSALLVAGLAAAGDPRASLEPVVTTWPFWVQVLFGTVISDFLGYWRHRVFHTSALWPIHAVHHSSTQLDWLSTRRFHPVNQIVTNMVHVGALFALGFPWPAIGATLVLRGVYGTFVHANVDLTYGPLDYLIVSPRFHRWHHSSDEQAIDRNFATLFSAWDWMFGTAYLPAGQRAQAFGLHGEKLQESWIAQLGYPMEAWLSPAAQEADAPASE